MLERCSKVYHNRPNHHSAKMASAVNINCVCVIFIGTIVASGFGKREMVKDLNKCEQCFGFGGGTRLEVKAMILKPTALCWS